MNAMVLTEEAPEQLPRTHPDWWRGAVIYQIYPRSFLDTNGDGIGDLAGITEKLDYVAGLGVDGIWVSPFFTSPMKDFGYDVADYTAVDPLFGTLADFDALVAEAHRLGLKVVIDQVLNHTSDIHPWFRESRASRDNPKSDWYVWADPKPDGTPPNNWLAAFGGPAWEWDTRRGQYYLHNFLAAQPDLNFHNPDVQDAVLAVLEFWLDRGVDGFRLDTVNFYFHDRALSDNPPAACDRPPLNPYNFQEHLYDKSRPENLDFLRRLRAVLDGRPGITTIGEVSAGERSFAVIAEYTSGGDKLHMGYSFEFLSSEFSRGFFRDAIESFEGIAGDGWPCWAFSNHDVTRHVSRWAAATSLEHDRLARLAAGLLLSLRGSVTLYEGEELGLPEAELAFEDLVDPYSIRFWPEYKGRDGCRTPMPWEAASLHAGFSTAKPWLPVVSGHAARAVDTQADDPESMLAEYRRLIAFRRAHPALRTGAIAILDAPDLILAFVREGAGERLLCVFNLGEEHARFDLPASTSATALTGHGFAGSVDDAGRVVLLPGGDAFFGAIA